MSRGGAVSSLVAFVALGAVVALVAGCRGAATVPTYTVEPQAFVERVTAEGVLMAEKVTPLTVAPEVRAMVRLAWLAADGSRLEPGDLVARFDPQPLEEQLASSRDREARAGHLMAGAAASAEAATAGLDSQHEMAAVELELAERFAKSDDELYSRHDILEARIDSRLAAERQRHAAEQRATRRRLTASEGEIHAIEQRQARIWVERAETGLAALEVRAPHGGLFTRARDWRGDTLDVGGELWSGQQLGEIPDLDSLAAQVFVLEADAGGVVAGQEAELIVESDPGRVLPATVARVDAVARPRVAGSPVQYFAVSLDLGAAREATMKPGQRVRATIYRERRDAALVVPRQAIDRGDDGPRVWVRDAAGWSPRTVELGGASRGLVVVRSGLAAGEEVALRRPPGVAPPAEAAS